MPAQLYAFNIQEQGLSIRFVSRLFNHEPAGTGKPIPRLLERYEQVLRLEGDLFTAKRPDQNILPIQEMRPEESTVVVCPGRFYNPSSFFNQSLWLRTYILPTSSCCIA